MNIIKGFSYLQLLGEVLRAAGVLDHADGEVRDAEADGVCHLRVHGGAEEHERTVVEVHKGAHERRGATDGAGDEVRCAVDELGERDHDDVGALKKGKLAFSVSYGVRSQCEDVQFSVYIFRYTEYYTEYLNMIQ